MSIAKTPSAEISYKGFTQTRTNENLQTVITYQSTEQKLNNMITGANHQTSGWSIGMSGVYGNLDKITMKQEEGPFWHADLQWNQPLNNGLIITTGDRAKPTYSSLQVNMMQKSIKELPKYADIWDHYLAYRSDYSGTAYTSATLVQISGALRTTNDPTKNEPALKWINDKSDKPEDETDDEGNILTWDIMVEPTKMGRDYYVYPVYEITEYARHSTSGNAAWSMATRSGRLKFPINGDFGLENKFFPGDASSNKYHWLCLGGDLSFDGKYWVARCTYRWSPDPNGWQLDMYEVAIDGYGNPAQSGNDIFDQVTGGNNSGNISNPILP